MGGSKKRNNFESHTKEIAITNSQLIKKYACFVGLGWDKTLPPHTQGRRRTTTNHDDGRRPRRLMDNQLQASINCIPDSGYVWILMEEEGRYAVESTIDSIEIG